MFPCYVYRNVGKVSPPYFLAMFSNLGNNVSLLCLPNVGKVSPPYFLAMFPNLENNVSLLCLPNLAKFLSHSF